MLGSTPTALREPHQVCRYLEDLAGGYHRFYDVCRVLPQGDEEPSDLLHGLLCAGDPSGDRQQDGVLGEARRSGCEHPPDPRHAEESTTATYPRTLGPDEVLALAPQVWPRSLSRGDDGVVLIAGVTDLAQYGLRAVRRRRGRLPRPVPGDNQAFGRRGPRPLRRRTLPVQ